MDFIANFFTGIDWWRVATVLVIVVILAVLAAACFYDPVRELSAYFRQYKKKPNAGG